jgi:hypothetical protein
MRVLVPSILGISTITCAWKFRPSTLSGVPGDIRHIAPGATLHPHEFPRQRDTLLVIAADEDSEGDQEYAGVELFEE